jgi:DNA polymerase-3 subunit gamma/tau
VPATAAGRTSVAVTAQVEGQPPVAASTTLPGAPSGPADAQAVADEAAAAVSAELATPDDPAPAVAAVAVVEPDAEAPEPAFSARVALSLESFAEVWPAVLASLREESPMLAALLEGARPQALADDGLTLAWPESSAFLKRKAEDPANRERIAGAIRAVTGSSLRLAYALHDDAARPPAAPQLSEEELVERFMTEFDAEELPPEEKES